MATVSSLLFEISLDSSKLKNGLSQSTTAVNRFAKTASKAIAGIAVASAAGYAAMLKNTVDTAKEIQNLSQLANTSTREFQRYAAAFKTVGFETDKTADIFKDMSDRVGDFVQTGGGPLADFFENIAPKVGVTAQQFRNLSGPDALQLYVSSLEKANVNQNEFAFYMEALASDTTALIPLLRNGGEEVKRLGDQAEAAGAVMSDLDIKQAGDIKAKLNEIGLAFTGVKNQIVSATLPAVTELMAELNKPEVKENIVALGTAIITTFTNAVGWVSSLTGKVRELAEDVAVFLNGIGSFDTKRLQDEIKMARGYLENGASWGTKVDLLFMDDDEIRKEIKRMEDQVASNLESSKMRLTRDQAVPSKTNIAPTPSQKTPTEQGLSPQAQRELDALAEQFETPMERLQRKLGDAKGFLGKYGDQNEIYSRMVKAAHDEYNTATKNLINSTDNLTNAMLSQGGSKTGNLNFDQSITSLRKAMLLGDEKQIAYYKSRAEDKFSGALRGGTTDIDTLELMRGTIDSLAQKAGMQTQAQEAQAPANKLIQEAMSANTEAVKGLSKWLTSTAEPMGSIDFNLTMDGGKMSTTLQGTPKHLKFLRDFVNQNTGNTATAVR